MLLTTVNSETAAGREQREKERERERDVRAFAVCPGKARGIKSRGSAHPGSYRFAKTRAMYVNAAANGHLNHGQYDPRHVAGEERESTMADSAPCYLARDNSSARPRILAMRVLPPFAFHVSILDISSGASASRGTASNGSLSCNDAVADSLTECLSRDNEASPRWFQRYP